MRSTAASAQDHPPGAHRPSGPTPAHAAGGPVIDSATLLQGGKAVTIQHNGEFYRLQATRQGKLILTK
jgi:hemin uptake protein HemP